ATGPWAARGSAARSDDRLHAPVLSARRGGPAERLGGALRNLHPAIVFVVLMLAGLAATALLSICLGFLVTRVLEPAWGIGAANERVNGWFAAQRTASRTDVSLVGSIIAGGVVLPIVVGSIAFVCAVLRRWRIAAFLVFVLGVESASYRLTTLVIHSHRPHVARLENLPVNASYPSGHTAASIAVYCGLALLIIKVEPRRRACSRLDLRRGDSDVRRTLTHVSRHASPGRRGGRDRRRRRRSHGPRLRLPGGRRGRGRARRMRRTW